MPRNLEPVATPNVIKWTDEEWQMIASRLLEEKGRNLLASPQMEEVKAKDVFNAQNVLAENRQRKLISISQGFQTIRQRLHGIMQKLEPVPRHDLFAASASSVDQPPLATDETMAHQPKSQKFERPKKARFSPVIDTPAAVRPEATIATIEAGQSVPQARGTEDKPSIEGLAPVGKQTRQATPRDVPSPVQRTAQPTHATHRRHTSPTPPRGSGDLIELARPFVAMVCQEFANALLKTMVEKGGHQAVASMLPAVAPGAASSPVNRQQDHRAFAEFLGNEVLGSRSQSLSEAAQLLDDEDLLLAETDVQPLFDPKLPPSANSAFKPMIALIATSTRDFEDLKQLYPQLELNVVALDDLRTAPSLRSCQRMIGLREEIPAPADDFLRNTFKNRYVRITGGVTQVREQLNTWLDNPGTINGATPSWPRKQGNVKGQGNGYPKKKPFSRPRPNP